MKHLRGLILLLLIGSFSFAQTEGELVVSVKTSDTGGEFKPRNVMAIWIENASGEYVKTLLAYAEKRKGYLSHWKDATTAAGSAYNVIDAISGATQSSHNTRTCTWNGTNFNGDTLNDGSYLLCMELTDKNKTGNYSTFDITKSAEVFTLTPGDAPSFSNISLAWTPAKTALNLIDDYNGYDVYPSPTNGVLEIKGKDIQSVEISNLNGKTVYKGNSTKLDISSYSNGIYFIKLNTSDNTLIKRIVKQ
ncbi:MAG: DUF2271 domain-containing protein [Prolixibacteraceae bacterium]